MEITKINKWKTELWYGTMKVSYQDSFQQERSFMSKTKNTDKRKDNKGRILRMGEYQRKDGTYDYRYTDSNHKRHSIYAPTLDELRKKEAEIHACRTLGADETVSVEELRKQETEKIVYAALGINLAAADTTVKQLLAEYVALKRNVRYSTRCNYQFVQSLVSKYDIADCSIRNIKVSDAQRWFTKLFDDGYSWNTISCVRSVIKPAFQMAFNEERIRRNPFDFRMDFLPNNTKKRVALSLAQQKQLLDFIANDKDYCKHLDEIVVLLGTGMRVSEFCGLTISDLDFEHRRINVNHQLSRTSNNTLYVEKTKTECGSRFIPMSDDVYKALYNILENRPRPKREPMVDGYTGFILLDRCHKPKIALHIECVVTRIWKKYNKEHVIPLPKITPHVFRHTFCTNMANAGMDLKSLQYLMGHSDASVTLNVYTHTCYEKAEKDMAKIVSFTDVQPSMRVLRKA